jgi:hypothetical protein
MPVRLQLDIDRRRTRPPCFALARAQGGHAERIHHPRRRDAATHKVSPLRTSRDARRQFAARAFDAALCEVREFWHNEPDSIQQNQWDVAFENAFSASTLRDRLTLIPAATSAKVATY